MKYREKCVLGRPNDNKYVALTSETLQMPEIRDYIQEEKDRIVVYITTCGILRRIWERCRDTVELLKALRIKAEFRDLNIDPSFADELADRMRLDPCDRELVYDSLPTVYVNGKYFGSHIQIPAIASSSTTSFTFTYTILQVVSN
ncbi:hypothetical protein NECAME_15504 [Necator americanus]|uniref:Glutaredoxin domain-containing protein n=1 Tax=Necator americanus TaxID=51031 RepID=W2SHS0_NECAM|nr:hypothetical protein NECAME_15504 [Necator americanus]ETN69118.1 hypothetical protein NECAME_15504 [Necator americanus]